ncbi:hypothetical protein SAMN06296952_0010 [Oscillospiraceae bacterium]|nr:hypothetical protein SAMN06296952_0010 [Oscillospiraceae bacterium]
MAITTKQFQLLTDINLVWDFLVDIYDKPQLFTKSHDDLWNDIFH